ncbi:MAG: divergent polysaccharide deacetylase family protein [Candidatus Omnitrophica bacterium]|nr:divergent polysaccharide deacetylase family protein [Candidatus Omnitrophota bacterium]
MNNFKNFVIFVLSVIILIQSVFLAYFIYRRAPSPKVSRAAVAPVRLKEAAPKKEVKPTVAAKPVIAPRPAVVLGRIALVIDDWGYNLKNRDFITDNDFHVTLSILPFKEHSTHVAQLAYHKNKDVIIHMPMEPQNKENYGLEENTILISMDKKSVVRLLDGAFAVVPYAKGISNHMGSKATEDTRIMKVVMEYLKSRDLFFLDSLVTSRSVCRGVARRFKLGFAQRDVFIDNESDAVYIRGQILKLAQRAKQMGVAVGIGHDRPLTIEVLKEMIPELEAEGYRFVNLSEIITTVE